MDSYTTRYLPHHQGLHPGHEEPQITQSTGRGVLVEEQTLPPVVSPTTESPGYVVESDPEEYEDDETKDGRLNFPMDRERMERCGFFGRLARCTDSSDISHHLLPHLYYLIWSPTQSKNIQVSLHASFVDAVTARIPSPPLHQYTVLYRPPPVDRRDDVPESEQPSRKRSCLFALGSRYEVRESSTARPTRGQGIDYGFVITIDAEERRRGSRKVGYGIRDTWGKSSRGRLFCSIRGRRYSLWRRRPMLPERLGLMRIALRYSYSDTAPGTGDQCSPLMRVMRLRVWSECIADTIMQHVTRRGPNTSPKNANPNNMPPESIKAMINQALLRNSTNGDGSHSSYGDNEGLWIEKMESVFNISGCAIENQVKFATCTLLGAALTWWNNQIRTLGPEAYSMTWEVLKKKMTDNYCPQGEIKKLEIELWNLKVKGNDVLTYTEHFQELTLICTKFVANETEKIDKYINGLPDNIYGNVKSGRPKTLDKTIELANELMDQKLRTSAERQSDNKRKVDDSSRNNHGHQQQPFKRQNVTKVYNMGIHVKMKRHFARDCRSSGNRNVANTLKGNGENPKGNGYFECRAQGYFKRDCPKLKNKEWGNGSA
ncbi:reverse transcriptase domain-containing protein [Tanacetum coccineum]|uniref:Reverse transcriptase domain-containing protein n=1 Tax=Tanacetum coccineum TaxID=301880 RepID=A0ABQ5EH57_9ASTR